MTDHDHISVPPMPDAFPAPAVMKLMSTPAISIRVLDHSIPGMNVRRRLIDLLELNLGAYAPGGPDHCPEDWPVLDAYIAFLERMDASPMVRFCTDGPEARAALH
ncbi:MAG: hypothetical protein OXD40_15455 [bacterium]|nr:hypothetical protein [bacterium]